MMITCGPLIDSSRDKTMMPLENNGKKNFGIKLVGVVVAASSSSDRDDDVSLFARW